MENTTCSITISFVTKKNTESDTLLSQLNEKKAEFEELDKAHKTLKEKYDKTCDKLKTFEEKLKAKEKELETRLDSLKVLLTKYERSQNLVTSLYYQLYILQNEIDHNDTKFASLLQKLNQYRVEAEEASINLASLREENDDLMTEMSSMVADAVTRNLKLTEDQEAIINKYSDVAEFSYQPLDSSINNPLTEERSNSVLKVILVPLPKDPENDSAPGCSNEPAIAAADRPSAEDLPSTSKANPSSAGSEESLENTDKDSEHSKKDRILIFRKISPTEMGCDELVRIMDDGKDSDNNTPSASRTNNDIGTQSDSENVSHSISICIPTPVTNSTSTIQSGRNDNDAALPSSSRKNRAKNQSHQNALTTDTNGEMTESVVRINSKEPRKRMCPRSNEDLGSFRN